MSALLQSVFSFFDTSLLHNPVRWHSI